jgi:hypothetical protein
MGYRLAGQGLLDSALSASASTGAKPAPLSIQILVYTHL